MGQTGRPPRFRPRRRSEQAVRDARSGSARPDRAPRRWPLYLIAAGLVLSVLWCGAILWYLAVALEWLVD